MEILICEAYDWCLLPFLFGDAAALQALLDGPLVLELDLLLMGGGLARLRSRSLERELLNLDLLVGLGVRRSFHWFYFGFLLLFLWILHFNFLWRRRLILLYGYRFVLHLDLGENLIVINFLHLFDLFLLFADYLGTISEPRILISPNLCIGLDGIVRISGQVRIRSLGGRHGSDAGIVLRLVLLQSLKRRHPFTLQLFLFLFYEVHLLLELSLSLGFKFHLIGYFLIHQLFDSFLFLRWLRGVGRFTLLLLFRRIPTNRLILGLSTLRLHGLESIGLFLLQLFFTHLSGRLE